MDLVDIMKQVREINTVWLHLYVEFKKPKQMNKQQTWLTDKENKLVVTVVETDVKMVVKVRKIRDTKF